MQSSALLTLGTRGSALALAQAEEVRRRLAAAHRIDPEAIAVRVISTTGDRLADRPLGEAGGKGLFSKEIEAAIAAGEVDVGVHSSKDMATMLPDGLVLSAFLEREDIRDAFVSLRYAGLDELPPGARLGTSSIRRAAQMLRHRPDLEIVGFRGNVQTRLKKLADGVADATLLAAAGLNRLGEAGRVAALLDPSAFPPAPAQGAIGLEIRADDARVADLVAPLNHRPTAIAIAAERALLNSLDGSCRTPIGAFTELNDTALTLTAEILSPNGREHYRATRSGRPADAVSIGSDLGETLLGMAPADFQRRFGG
jgi:hydroxymethylbilane synthase